MKKQILIKAAVVEALGAMVFTAGCGEDAADAALVTQDNNDVDIAHIESTINHVEKNRA